MYRPESVKQGQAPMTEQGILNERKQLPNCIFLKYQRSVRNVLVFVIYCHLICIILLNLFELWLCLFILFKEENVALKCLGDCQDFSSLCVSNGIIQKHALSNSVLTPKKQSLMCPICFCFPYCRLEIHQAI